MDEIAMALAERVVDLAEDRPQGPRAVVAEPEAHRIEHVAQHAGHGHQHDLAVAYVRHALLAQDAVQPEFEVRTIPRAMVGAAEGDGAAAVELQPAAGGGFQRIEAQAEIAHLVAERVLARPQPPMDDGGVDDRMGRRLAHDVSAAVRAATGIGSGGIAGRSATTRGGSPIRRCSSGRGQGRCTPSCSATSSPADSASSWKP